MARVQFFDIIKTKTKRVNFSYYNLSNLRGTIGGKTGKTSVLPGFSKIECGSGGAPHSYGGLTYPRRVRRAGGASESHLIFKIRI